MKNLYNTPIITVEEMKSRDVLCSSGEIETKKHDNSVASGAKGGLNSLFNLDYLL